MAVDNPAPRSPAHEFSLYRLDRPDAPTAMSGSARAIQALLAETDLRVAGIQSIANWDFPEMRTRLAPWPVRALTSYPQVLAGTQEAGLVSATDVGQLLHFYADPRQHSWPA